MYTYVFTSTIRVYTNIHDYTRIPVVIHPNLAMSVNCTSAFIMYTCTYINSVYFGSLYFSQVGLEMSLVLGLHLSSSDIPDLTFFFSFSHTFPLIVLLLGR
jgi:hypothetical protein